MRWGVQYPISGIHVCPFGKEQAEDIGGTPTLARMGVYSSDGSGNLTLLASTTNDTSLITSAWTMQTRSLSTSVNLVAGNTYAFGLVIVSSNAMPEFMGVGGTWSEYNALPRIAGRFDGVTDLPSSVDYWDVWSSGATIYFRGE